MEEWVIALVLLSPFIAGLLYLFFEMMRRSKYPVRARIHESFGGNVENRARPVAWEDRLGYVKTKIDGGQEIAGGQWQLGYKKAIVNDFSSDYIYEQYIYKIPFIAPKGLKKAMFADIYARSGKEGWEFYPMKVRAEPYNEQGIYIEPKFTTDDDVLRNNILNSTKARTTIGTWIQQNLQTIVLGSMVIIVAALLFLSFLELKNVATALQQTGGAISESNRFLAELYGKNVTKNIGSPQQPAQGGQQPSNFIPGLPI